MNTMEYKVLEQGTTYALPNYVVEDGKGIVQSENATIIQFVRGSKIADEQVEKKEGIVMDALLAMMIEDLTYKNSLVPSEETERALFHLKSALDAMNARTYRRSLAGTLGTYKK